MVRMRPFQDYLIDKLSSDPDEILCYFKATLEEYHRDGNEDAFMIALDNIDSALDRRAMKIRFRKPVMLAARKYAELAV